MNMRKKQAVMATAAPEQPIVSIVTPDLIRGPSFTRREGRKADAGSSPA
jgi:hypothetical protein